jgi:hypothetical protein
VGEAEGEGGSTVSVYDDMLEALEAKKRAASNAQAGIAELAGAPSTAPDRAAAIEEASTMGLGPMVFNPNAPIVPGINEPPTGPAPTAPEATKGPSWRDLAERALPALKGPPAPATPAAPPAPPEPSAPPSMADLAVQAAREDAARRNEEAPRPPAPTYSTSAAHAAAFGGGAKPPSGGGGGGAAVGRPMWVPSTMQAGFWPADREQVDRLYGAGLANQVAGAGYAVEAARAKGEADAAYSAAKEDVERAHADAVRSLEDQRSRYIDDQMGKLDQMAARVASADISSYWSDKSAPTRVLTAIAVGLGAAGAALSGGRNTAADMLTQEMDRDLKRKVLEAEAARSGFYAAKNNFMENIAAFGSKEAALVATRAQTVRVLETMAQRKYQRAMQDGGWPDLEANYRTMIGQIGERGSIERAKLSDLMRDHWSAQYRFPQAAGGGGAGTGLPDFDAGDKVLNLFDANGRPVQRIGIGSDADVNRLRSGLAATTALQRIFTRMSAIIDESRNLGPGDVQRVNQLNQEYQDLRATGLRIQEQAQHQGVLRQGEMGVAGMALGAADVNLLAEHAARNAPLWGPHLGAVRAAYELRNATLGDALKNAQVEMQAATNRFGEMASADILMNTRGGYTDYLPDPSKKGAIRPAVVYTEPLGPRDPRGQVILPWQRIATPGAGLVTHDSFMPRGAGGRAP